jgi:hypothetical protein
MTTRKERKKKEKRKKKKKRETTIDVFECPSTEHPALIVLCY